MGMVEERESWWRSIASATLEERAVLLRQAQAQEGTLLERMTQIGQALQRFSTDATLNESQRRDQELVIANLQTHAINLKSAGQNLEHQHQQTLSMAEARVQAMMSEATANYAAVERRAQEAEETLRRIQLESLDAERKVRAATGPLSPQREAPTARP